MVALTRGQWRLFMRLRMNAGPVLAENYRQSTIAALTKHGLVYRNVGSDWLKLSERGESATILTSQQLLLGEA
jgi:hypothetical protein